MANMLAMAVQNRDSEAERKRREKDAMYQSLLSGGEESDEGSSSGGSYDDDSGSLSGLSSSDYQMPDLSSDINSPSLGESIGQFAGNMACSYAKEKIDDALQAGVKKLGQEGLEKLAKEGVEEALEAGLKWGAKKLLREGIEAGLKFIPIIGTAFAIYDAVDTISRITTGKGIIENGVNLIKGDDDSDSDEEKEIKEKEEKAKKEEEESRKKAEEEFKKHEEEEKARLEEEKRRIALEDASRKKKELEAKNKQEEDDDEDEEDEEDANAELPDEKSKGNNLLKKALKGGLFSTFFTFGGSMALAFSMIGMYRLHFTGEFEYKGIGAEYQSLDYLAQNFMTYDENGDVVLTGMTKENKLIKTFYTYYSDKSYYAIVEDSEKYDDIDDAYKRENLLTPEELREKYPDIEDLDKREVMFQLNPEVLYVLDKYVHQDEVLYPQQFIKPVSYVENQSEFGLKDLVDNKGNLNVTSQSYGEDGIPLKNNDGSFKTESGIWDYGFAPILRYQEHDVPIRETTSPVKREIYDENGNASNGVSSNKTVNGETLAPGPIPDVGTTTVDKGLRDKPAYIIDTAVTPGGTITNEIDKKWVVDESTRTTFTQKKEVEVWVSGYNWVEDVDSPNCVMIPNYVTGTMERSCPMKEEFVEKHHKVKYEVVDTYLKYREEELPYYKGDPSTEGLVGSKYFRDYLDKYTNYFPAGLPNKFDFEVLNDEEVSKLIYDDDPSSFVLGGNGTIELNGKKIVVDAGHGGADGGASGFVVEKEVVLSISKLLKTELEALGYEVTMTREDDSRPLCKSHSHETEKASTLCYRSTLANKINPSAFVSIHANAPAEGSSSSIKGVMTLWKNNVELAQQVQDEMVKATNASVTPDSDDGTGLQYRDDLHLLNKVNSPSVLVETGYVTNQEEANKLKDTEYQKKMAKGIANGIHKFLTESSSGKVSSSNARLSRALSNSNNDTNEISDLSQTYTLSKQRTSGNISVGADIATQFAMSSQKDSGNVKQAMQYFDYFNKYGNMYGVDPYLLIAIASQESSGNHSAHISSSRCSSAGCGIMQIEKPGNVITKAQAYNHQTGQVDEVQVTYSLVTNVEDNIRVGAMLAAERMKLQLYNILIGLQGYNFGSGAMGKVLEAYSQKIGKTIDEIKANHSDTGWLEYVVDLHNNPQKYVNWSKPTYGDDEYLMHVLRYYAGTDKPWVMKEDGTIIYLDGSLGFGTYAGGSANPASSFNQYLSTNWQSVEDLFDKLFPGQKAIDEKLELVQKGTYDELYSNYTASARNRTTSSEKLGRVNKEYFPSLTQTDKQLALNMMFAMNQSNYLFKYDGMGEAEWKAMYTQLLSSPTGKTWDDEWIGFTKTDIFGTEDVGKLFAEDSGVSPTISVPYGTYKNAFTEDTSILISQNITNFGIDIVVPPETEVLAVADGEVIGVEKGNNINTRYGNYVVIKHFNGKTQTTTANLKDVNVKKGDKISKGDVIGTSGGESKSYRNNALHFEIRHDGELINPTWIITGEMTGFKDPIESNSGGGTISSNGANGNISSIVQKMIEVGKSMFGVGYKMGANGPDRYDCSHFMWKLIKEAGIDVGYRTAYYLHADAQEVSYEQLQPGDFVFWHDKLGTQHSPVSHVAMYIGVENGEQKIIHCSSGKGVNIANLPIEETNKYKFTYGRMPEIAGATSGTTQQQNQKITY